MWRLLGRSPKVPQIGKDPPYRMSREAIEKSFTDQGFQLYKMKKAAVA